MNCNKMTPPPKKRKKNCSFFFFSLEKQLLFILKEDHLSPAIWQFENNFYKVARLSREGRVGN